MLRFVCFFGELLLLLALDIILTIFANNVYNDWIYYTLYFVLTLIVAIINNNGLNRTKEAVCNTLVPLLIIPFLYLVYSLLLPSLYYVYYTNLSNMSTIFLIIYAYPLFDLIFYSLVLFLGTKVEDDVKSLFSVIHFMLLGYGVGMILIVGYT